MPDEIKRLYGEVDESAEGLAVIHADRLNCRRGCSACCVDGLTVFEVEAENIKRHHARLLAEGEPHAAGACAFLDEAGACRIYAERPYVCRTQGLPLRWLEETDEEEESIVEMRDICPLNDEGVPIEELSEEECWTLGPFEQRLAHMQAAHGSLRRIPLRELFARTSDENE